VNNIRKSDIFSHWVNLSYLPRWGVLLLDLFIVLVSFTISIIIGSHLWEYKLPDLLIPNLGVQAAIVVVLQMVFFWVFHTYSGILRYSTFVDIIKVILAVVSCTLILVGTNVVCRLMHTPTPFLTTSLIIYLFVSICLLFVWRVTIKTTFVYISHHHHAIKKVLIYGTQSAGLSIAKMLQSNLESQYQPVGFIVDHHDNQNHNLLGLPLYPMNADLIPLMQRKEIGCIIVSPMKMQDINPLKDLSIFIENNIQILTTPYFTDFHDSSSSDQLRP
jgi:FlaA1/EpsC-like NDP-sugar epimerase